jgi:hypothetical protein
MTLQPKQNLSLHVKGKVYVPPLARDLPELRQRIVAAVDTIDVDMLQRVCGKN